MKAANRITFGPFIAVFFCFVFSVSCALVFRTEVPVKSLSYYSGSSQSKNLIIFLPGRMSAASDFEKHGFIKALMDSGLSTDAISVEAHTGYYYNRNLIERLYEDIIIPSKNRGYEKIWICGTSMGGLGAALYARNHPDTIKGILLIAPYLGENEVITEIKASGGLNKWAPALPLQEGDFQRDLWLWCKDNFNSAKSRVLITAGYGTEDKYTDHNDAVELLTAGIPSGGVFRVEGGHEWAPWLEIFKQFLESGIFPGK